MHRFLPRTYANIKLIMPLSPVPLLTMHRFLLLLLSGWLPAAPLLADAAGSRTVLTNQHADFRILYQPAETNVLSIGIATRVEDALVTYAATNVLLVVAEHANLKHPANPLGLQDGLPAGTPFGEAGDPLWILPQAQDASLLYLGFSAEKLPPGVFDQPFNFRLRAVRGPGHFFAWQADEAGNLLVKFNSRDGITEADATRPLLGSHEHFNFGFTTNGQYEVTFQVTGHRAGVGTNDLSDEATFLFAVEPVPLARAPAVLRIVRVAEDDGVLVEVHGGADATYDLQASEDLTAWAPLGSVTLTGNTATVPVPAGGTKRFIRALVP